MIWCLVGHLKNQAMLTASVMYARWSLRDCFGPFYRVFGEPAAHKFNRTVRIEESIKWLRENVTGGAAGCPTGSVPRYGAFVLVSILC